MSNSIKALDNSRQVLLNSRDRLASTEVNIVCNSYKLMYTGVNRFDLFGVFKHSWCLV